MSKITADVVMNFITIMIRNMVMNMNTIIATIKITWINIEITITCIVIHDCH